MPITWTGPLSFALYSLHHKARDFFLACATVDSAATRCSARIGLCKSLSSHTPCPEVLWIFFSLSPPNHMHRVQAIHTAGERQRTLAKAARSCRIPSLSVWKALVFHWCRAKAKARFRHFGSAWLRHAVDGGSFALHGSVRYLRSFNPQVVSPPASGDHTNCMERTPR